MSTRSVWPGVNVLVNPRSQNLQTKEPRRGDRRQALRHQWGFQPPLRGLPAGISVFFWSRPAPALRPPHHGRAVHLEEKIIAADVS